jgi:phospholipid/cholesterol/gamma-HCH transport system permease protein
MLQQHAINVVRFIGRQTIAPIEALGGFVAFFFESLRRIFFPPVSLVLLLRQMEFVGNRSFWVIVLAGCMVGGIFGFQLGEIFRVFGAESMMGAAAAYTLSREMAPVVGAMLVAGRAGSSMAAEIAIMRVNEQIDAMGVMAVNPYGYLVAPRILATVIMMPILSSIFVLSGVMTAFIVGVGFYDVDVGLFIQKITFVVAPKDVFDGLVKALVFGLIFSSVGCYRGFFASGGARGVGRATTSSVVISFVLILISDFVITYFQYRMRG